MKKGVIIAIILVAGGGGIYYLMQQNQAIAPTQEPNQNQEQALNPGPTPVAPVPTPTPSGSPTPSPEPEPEGGETPAPDIQVIAVEYDGTKYSPSSVNIKVNDWVFFKNSSDTEFWPASAPHPSHTDYPELDPKEPIAKGGQFKFQFTKAGNWKFHDHLNPKASGTINVSQ